LIGWENINGGVKSCEQGRKLGKVGWSYESDVDGSTKLPVAGLGEDFGDVWKHSEE
jgi:hypothetical protein